MRPTRYDSHFIVLVIKFSIFASRFSWIFSELHAVFSKQGPQLDVCCQIINTNELRNNYFELSLSLYFMFLVPQWTQAAGKHKKCRQNSKERTADCRIQSTLWEQSEYCHTSVVFLRYYKRQAWCKVCNCLSCLRDSKGQSQLKRWHSRLKLWKLKRSPKRSRLKLWTRCSVCVKNSVVLFLSV